MQITILGELGALVDGRAAELGGPKQRAVFAALVVDRGATIGVDRLIDLVWDDAPPARAEGTLQAYVSRLRRALEPGRAAGTDPTVIVTRRGGYALEVPDGAVDADRFRAAVDEARRAVAEHRTTDAVDAYDRALDLWGPVLPEFPHERFATGIRLQLEDLAHAAVEERAQLLLDLGRHAELLGELEAAAEAEPLRERRWAQLALARYRSGQQSEALRAIGRARAVLVDRVGLDPGPELLRLESEILGRAPSLDLPPAPDGGTDADPTIPEQGAATNPAAGEHVEGDGTSAEPTRTLPFVGRDEQLAALVAALGDAVGGSGRVAVVSGEPGIGKTRLVEELAARARADGVAVAWAGCPESAATEPLRPIEQLGLSLFDQGAVEPISTGHPEAEGAVDAHVEAVRAITRRGRPFVAVIDDLQWADPSTLRVVERIAAELRHVPVLLAVTIRPPDAGSPAALVECLGELARQPGAVRLSLTGLRLDDVDAWIDVASHAPDPLDPDAGRRRARFVHDRSGGNPFFVQELIALLDAEGASAGSAGVATTPPGVPDAVADVIRRRVSRLPASTQQLLPLAAVVGRTFAADVVAAVSNRGPVDVLDDLDPAIDAGIVQEDPDAVGRFRFSHALVADALVAELSAGRRTRAHAAAALAIESLRGGAVDEHLAEIEHHALAGALAGTAELAVTASSRAAERSEQIGAHEDAAQHLAVTLRALELARPTDVRARHEALVRLGVARRSSDDAAGAISAFAEAIAAAEELGDVPAMAAAATLLNEPSPWQSGDYGADNLVESAVVERVLDRLPDEDSTVRALLLGALAMFVYYRDAARCDAVSAEAVAMARRVGDPATLVRVLNNRAQACWRADRSAERAAVAAEMRTLVEEHRLEPSLEFLARFTDVVTRCEHGDDPEPELPRLRSLAQAAGSSTPVNQLGWFETGLLGAQGRDEESLRLGLETYEQYRRTRRWSAGVIYLGYVFLARIDSGQREEAFAGTEDLDLGDYADSFGGLSGWALLEIGEPDGARLVLGDPVRVPPLRDDWLWLAATTLLGLAVAQLGDKDAARALLDLLGPHAGAMPVAGTNLMSSSVDQALGRLHLSLGEPERALASFDRGLELERGMGLVAWWTRGLVARAEAHLALGDRSSAERDLDEARRAAERSSLRPVLERIEAVSGRLQDDA